MKTKYKLNEIFEPVEKMFDFYLLGINFISQPKLQQIMIKNNPAIKNQLDEYNNEISLKINGDNSIEAKTQFYLIRTGIFMSINIFDILLFSEYHSCLKNEEIFKFTKHIRNGSAHNNKFLINPPIKNPIKWRNKTITNLLNGNTVFPEFINTMDLLFLMKDISDIIEKKFKKDIRNK